MIAVFKLTRISFLISKLFLTTFEYFSLQTAWAYFSILLKKRLLLKSQELEEKRMLTANLDGERIFFMSTCVCFFWEARGVWGDLLHHHHPSRANVIDSDDAEQ